MPNAWGATILRVAMGLVFLMHGGQKFFQYGLSGTAGSFESMGIPLPMVSATLAAGAEFFGGLLLILGLATRIAAIFPAIVMLVAWVSVHRGAYFLANNGAEYVITLLLGLVALMFLGGGPLSIDALVAGRSHAARNANLPR